MSIIMIMKIAIADAIVTSLWIFTLPLLGITSSTTSNFLGVLSFPYIPLLLTLAFATIRLFIFTFIRRAFGGAAHNPVNIIAFHAAGLRKPASSFLGTEFFLLLAVRLPAQAAGAAIGAKAILQVLPAEYVVRFKGPVINSDLLEGAVVELVLTFGFCLGVLVILLRGPKSLVVKCLLIVVNRMGLIRIGSRLSPSPSINPAVAFGWAYVNNLYASWGFYCVYWAAPFLGAALAGLVFSFVFASPPPKQKQA